MTKSQFRTKYYSTMQRGIAIPTSAILLLLTFFVVPVSVHAQGHWPNWRGPDADGATRATNLPLSWGEDQNIRWKTPLPAWAGSSPVIWGDYIFLTTPASKDEDAAEGDGIGRRLRRISMEGPGGDKLYLLCISRKDGSLLWKKTLDKGNKLYGKHNMASPSPVTDGRHVWTMTGTGKLTCHDFNGEMKWQRDLQKDYGKFGLYWGYAASPILYKDTVIVSVLHGSETKDPSYLAAFDMKTGKTLWREERRTDAEKECPDAYTTPIIAKVNGKDAIIISGADYVTAHEPSTGKEIWRAGGLNPDKSPNYRICGTPVSAGGLIIATSRERPVLALRRDGKGDVTTSNLAWKYDDKKAPDVPSVAFDGTYLYLLHDNGFLTCLKAADGSVAWGPERITGGPYSASPLVGDGRVYVTNEDAVTTVFATGPEFKELAKNKLDGGYTLSSFAVADGELFLRTQKCLYCITQKQN